MREQSQEQIDRSRKPNTRMERDTDMYKLIWKNEVIKEHLHGIDYAREIQREYETEYKGHVTIVIM